MKELAEAITQYTDQWNLNLTQYEWKAEGKVILERIVRAREALAREARISKPI